MATTFQAFKYRIYPTDEQIEVIERTFKCCRFVWNHFLERTSKIYDRRQESMSKFDCMKVLTEMRERWPWLEDCGCSAERYAIVNLFEARKAFFRRIKAGEKPGYPKFKSARCPSQSFTTAGTIYVTDECIQVPFGSQYQKINKVKRGSGRPAVGIPREVTISRSSTGKYWASVCCMVEREELPVAEGEVGISLGLKELAIDSNGVHYENPKHLSKSAKRLAREQRRLSRKQKGSANYEKNRKLVAEIHEHIANQRRDYRHKISRELVNSNQLIAVEKVAVKSLVEGNEQAKSILDAGWSELTSMIKYKAEWAGRTLVDVDTATVAPEAKHDEALAQVVLSEGQRMASEQKPV